MPTTQQLITQFRAARETLETRSDRVLAALALVQTGSRITPETFAGLSPMTQRLVLSQAQAADRMSRSILRKSP